MTFKTLQNLWPAPDLWSKGRETFEEEKARLDEDGSIELIEKTATQRVIRFKDAERIVVQGTQKDWELTVQSNCSLGNAIYALKQVAFYAYMGARIPDSLAHYFAHAVNEMAEEYERNENAELDDSAVAKQCLKVLGNELGILGGHRRPTASYKLVGYYYELMFNEMWDQEHQKVTKRMEESQLSEAEINCLEDEAMEIAAEIAREAVQIYFGLSKQQTNRYLEKHEYWRDYREEP